MYVYFVVHKKLPQKQPADWKKIPQSGVQVSEGKAPLGNQERAAPLKTLQHHMTFYGIEGFKEVPIMQSLSDSCALEFFFLETFFFRKVWRQKRDLQ